MGLEERVHFIRGLWAVLSEQKDLSPNNEVVNHSLTNLVAHITASQDFPAQQRALQTLTSAGVASKLRELCQAAEVELERHWGERLLAVSAA